MKFNSADPTDAVVVEADSVEVTSGGVLVFRGPGVERRPYHVDLLPGPVVFACAPGAWRTVAELPELVERK